jgi:hypothetical protein
MIFFGQFCFICVYVCVCKSKWENCGKFCFLLLIPLILLLFEEIFYVIKLKREYLSHTFYFPKYSPQKETHPKKNRPAGWRKGLRVALCVVPTNLRASLPRKLCQQSEIYPHTWFAKQHKNKPTQKKNSLAEWRDGLRVALCVVSALPLLLSQKQTH